MARRRLLTEEQWSRFLAVADDERAMVRHYTTLGHKSTSRRSRPAGGGDQATLRVVGMLKRVMMFMTLQPTVASTFWAGRVRARRLRPISCL